ncbi:hypothetical protein E2C01_002777 [Portunus trituberculatus]|uniref:Uncharacterized protein n=1 Tax=Portunus trituberculatus TaxID=210409 RepID=A0A5B7CKU1_PORTR|nr:hypothetical protein [Portunus trituberculatus]
MFLILRQDVGDTLGTLCGLRVLKAGPCHTLGGGRPTPSPPSTPEELCGWCGNPDAHRHTSQSSPPTAWISRRTCWYESVNQMNGINVLKSHRKMEIQKQVGSSSYYGLWTYPQKEAELTLDSLQLMKSTARSHRACLVRRSLGLMRESRTWFTATKSFPDAPPRPPNTSRICSTNSYTCRRMEGVIRCSESGCDGCGVVIFMVKETVLSLTCYQSHNEVEEGVNGSSDVTQDMSGLRRQGQAQQHPIRLPSHRLQAPVRVPLHQAAQRLHHIHTHTR